MKLIRLIKQMRPRNLLCREVLTLLFLASVSAFAAPDLYGSGVRAESVKQGSLGSCYFHSAIAAIAASDPAIVEKAIQTIKDGQWKVTFADGKSENVYLGDVEYTRKSGFDRSDGLWVPILFRAYAQRIMREGLLEAVAASDLPMIVKSTGKSFFSSSDLLLMIYD